MTNGKGKPKNGFRMTKNRKKLLERGFTIEQILENELNGSRLPLSAIEPLIDGNAELSDAEILANQLNFFDVLHDTAQGVLEGKAKSLVLSGGAGIGKSYGITNIVKESNDNWINTGHVTHVGLYQILYEYRFKNCCIVFDDSDSVLNDEKCLGLLKHALDNKDKRTISRKSNAEIVDTFGETIPDKFTFEASIIFITNKNLSSEVSQKSKLSPHIEAIISRSLYMDGYRLFKSPRDYLIRLNYLKESIFNAENVDLMGRQIISDFITANFANMRELSLRLVSNLCRVYNIHGSSGFHNAAKFTTTKIR